MKILAVDYDGVLSDSALKSLFVSHNAYCRHFGPEVKKNFNGQIFTFENWELMQKKYQKEMAKYKQLRSYIELSSDFFVILKIIEEQIEINNQAEFIKYRENLDFNYQVFHDLFFQEKERWQNKDFSKWFSLSPGFQEAVNGVKKLLSDGKKVVIATSNMGKAIHPAFHPDYLGFYIDLQEIFDKNYGKNKTEHMQAIVRQYQVDLKDIFFIDDQLSYLEETKLMGVNSFLAGWGYCTAEHKKIAREKEIKVVEKQEDFYPLFEKLLA